MNRSEIILEKFVTAFRPQAVGGKGLVDVYENPKLQEMETLGPIIRFIIDDNKKKVWIWDAEKTIHFEVAEKLKLIKSSLIWRVPKLGQELDYSMIWGVASKQGKKLKMNRSDQIEAAGSSDKRENTNEIENYLKRNWKWAERYIMGITSFIRAQK